jgi:hypothetical protein
MIPIGTPLQNEILKDYTPLGASDETGTAEGIFQHGSHVSALLAERDYGRVAPLKAIFEAAGDHVCLPPAVLAAIASRESHCGLLLDKNGWGDNGHAYGICQIDKRAHNFWISPPASQGYLNQVAAILASIFQIIRNRHPDWAEASQLQGAIAAYNVGCGNVRTIEGIDIGTTHNDYSNDVWARAQYYAGLCGV